MKKVSLLFLGIMSFLCVSCGDDPNGGDQQLPWVTPISAEVGAESGSYVFELREVMEGLTVTSNQTWCSGSINGTEMTVTFTRNDGNSARTAILSLLKNNAQPPLATVALTQSYSDTEVTLSIGQDVVKVPAAEHESTVSVECNIEWKAQSDADWLTITPRDDELIIISGQNPNGSVRKGRVSVSAGKVTKYITVEQEGALLSTYVSSVELLATAEERSFDIVASNVEWEAVCDVSWLTAANEDGVLKLTPIANGGETRSANVTVKAGNITKKVEVTQFSRYQSLVGLWTISGQAISAEDGGVTLVDRSYTVEIKEKVKNKSLWVDKFGTGYLLAEDTAPFTMDIDAGASSVSVTMGETIGTFVFMGFPMDPNATATAKSVYMYISNDGGQEKVNVSLTGGEIITGNVDANLNTITLEERKGMGFGLWAYSSGEWSGLYCSYRMFNMTLTRQTLSSSSAVSRAPAVPGGENRCD